VEGDTNTGVVGAQNAQPNSQQGATPPGAPAGRTISDAEYATFQRYKEQLSGQAPLIEKVTSLGFKSPEDFGPLEAIKGRGIDFRRLADSLGQPVEEESEFDPKAAFEELRSGFEKKMTERERAAALKEWESGYTAEQKRLDALAAELAGEEADAFTKTLYRQTLENKAWAEAQDFEDGHPLKGSHRRPHSDEGFNKLAEWVKSERAKAKGEGMNAIAKAASQPSLKPTAGSQGNQGAPKKDSNTKEDIEDRIRSKVAGLVNKG
jgi:hypothetical protein